MFSDEKYMLRCIELAKNGLGLTYPNPMVGSVIVHNERIIGEGYHVKAGEPHAEVNAINSVANKALLKDSVIYVSLEPCSHYGKTPPCSELIIKSGIPKVVIGCEDTFSKVSGRGIKMLEDAGCEVLTGVLEKECRNLNKRFFTFHEKKRPYVILKWAQTLDGFIDVIRDENHEIQPTWISGETSKQLVHKWRAEEQSILVGTNTALKDNPGLDVREWAGENPLRLVIDKKLKLDKSFKLLNGKTETLIFSYMDFIAETKNSEVISLSKGSDFVEEILNVLYERGVQSVIIEGGRVLLDSFIFKNVWDEARAFVGNKSFIKGIKAPNISCNEYAKVNLAQDEIRIYFNS